MKISTLFLVGILSLSFNVLAEDENKDQTQKPGQGHVENLVKEGKSSRKKKVQMCHDCGKPETQCTCEGEEHKKEDGHSEEEHKKHE